MPHTIELSRVFRAPPERVYRAFLEPAALAKWLPPHGYTCTVEALDARVGGRFRMAFTQFSRAQSHHFGGEYLALEPGALLRYTDHFDDPQWPGQMVTTVRLRAVPSGTVLEVAQTGVPDTIPADACHLGWQESLAQLAQLVEPDFPG